MCCDILFILLYIRVTYPGTYMIARFMSFCKPGVTQRRALPGSKSGKEGSRRILAPRRSSYGGSWWRRWPGRAGPRRHRGSARCGGGAAARAWGGADEGMGRKGCLRGGLKRGARDLGARDGRGSPEITAGISAWPVSARRKRGRRSCRWARAVSLRAGVRCLRGDGAAAWDADCWAWHDSGDAGVGGRRLTSGARWQAGESGRAHAEIAAWARGGAKRVRSRAVGPVAR